MPEARSTSYNQPIIEEFRANGGVVGGPFEGATLLLLTTIGARSGRPRISPLTYLRDGERLLVFASNAGQDSDPAWYHNLVADPFVSFEIGEDGELRTYGANAAPLEGEERDRRYAEQADRIPRYAEYQANTARTIPVVALQPFRLDPNPARNRAIGEGLLRHHAELRAELARVRTEIDNVLAGELPSDEPGQPDRPGPDLRHELFEHCLTACANLHTHHRREEWGFLALRNGFPDLAPTLDRIRTEHEKVARTLDEVQELVTRVRSAAGPAEISEVRAELERLSAALEEHFAYEEAQLIPALDAVPAK